MEKAALTEKKVFAYLEEYHMLSQGDRVVVGVSGGADSVCLLLLLCEYRKCVPIELTAVHVDHGIRQEALRDAAFVRDLCERLKVPFKLVRADVPAVAGKRGMSVEEAGREVRYEAFAEAARGGKIAVAHNRNDRGETVLFNLFRGTGMKGLGGIRPVRDNIIRPVLCLSREEIEAYLADRGESFVEDATNNEDEYTRNRIRHHILPYAENEICKGSTEHLAKCAEQLAEAEDLLWSLTREACGNCVSYRSAEEAELNLAEFDKLHIHLKKRVLYAVIGSLTDDTGDIGAIHVDELLDICSGRSGRRTDLPRGLSARREFDRVVLVRRVMTEGHKRAQSPKEPAPKAEADGSAEKVPAIDIPVSEGQEVRVDLSDLVSCRGTLVFRVFSCEKGAQVPTEQYTKQFDYDKIKGTLQIRHRLAGDVLTIRRENGEIGRKSLKEYMIGAKIPAGLRGTMPVLVAGDHVVWLVGHRIGEEYKVDEGTKRILQVDFLQSNSET